MCKRAHEDAQTEHSSHKKVVESETKQEHMSRNITREEKSQEEMGCNQQ